MRAQRFIQLEIAVTVTVGITPNAIWVLVIVLIIIYFVFWRGVAHRQQLRQYDAEKAEDNLSTKKIQRDDMIAQKVIALK